MEQFQSVAPPIAPRRAERRRPGKRMTTMTLEASIHRAPALHPLPRRSGVYLVGGTVRDLLLHGRPADVDLAVLGDPRPYALELAARLGVRAVPIGRPGQMVLRAVAGGIHYDVSGIPDADLRRDLERRDFTVNAMACALAEASLVDPCGGRADLDRRCLRMTRPEVFAADPARLLRAFRLEGALGFQLDGPTREAIAREAHRLPRVAGERIREEVVKLLTLPAAVPQLEGLAAAGLLDRLLPEAHRAGSLHHGVALCAKLEAALAGPSDLHPRLRARYAVPGGERRLFRVKLAALLLPRPGPDGAPGAPLPGSADPATAAWGGWHLARRDEAALAVLIGCQSLAWDLLSAHREDHLTAERIVEAFTAAGAQLPDLLLLARLQAGTGPVGPSRVPGDPRLFYDRLIHYYMEVHLPRQEAPRLLGGADLMRELGLAPSPDLGRILAALERLRLAGRLHTRSQALAAARRLAAGAEPL